MEQTTETEEPESKTGLGFFFLRYKPAGPFAHPAISAQFFPPPALISSSPATCHEISAALVTNVCKFFGVYSTTGMKVSGVPAETMQFKKISGEVRKEIKW